MNQKLISDIRTTQEHEWDNEKNCLREWVWDKLDYNMK